MERDSKKGKGGKGKGGDDRATTPSDVPPAAGSRGPSGATGARRCSTAMWSVSGSTGSRTGTRWRARRRRPGLRQRWPRLQVVLTRMLVEVPPRQSRCAPSADAGDPPPIQSGCGYRGDAGLAHVGCRAEAAGHKARSGDIWGWQKCMTCGQIFTGQMGLRLAEVWWSSVNGFDEKNEDRQAAGNLLAQALSRQGRHAECEEKCRELRAVQRRISRLDSANSMHTAQMLGNALFSQGKYVDAEVVYREVLAKRRELLGGEVPETLTTLMTLGNVLSAQDKLDDALAAYRNVRTVQERVLGAEHMNTLTTTTNIAIALHNQHKYQESELLYRDVIGVQQRVLGPEHPVTLVTRILCAGRSTTRRSTERLMQDAGRCWQHFIGCLVQNIPKRLQLRNFSH